MTDARAGRVAEKVLAEPSPSVQVGRVMLKVLANTKSLGQVGRVAEKVLAEPSPVVQVGSVALKVLAAPSSIGVTVSWLDDSMTLQTATIEGQWDGTTIQALDWAATAWWDGTASQPLA